MTGLPCLSLHQPWASLVALGIKHIETRSWPAPKSLIGTHIGIHAAARPTRWSEMEPIIEALAAQEDGPKFLGYPDRWYEPHAFRCERGHVSTCVLKSEELGRDACLAAGCRAPITLTFPEDRDDVLGAIVATARIADCVPMVDDRFARNVLDVGHPGEKCMALRRDDNDGTEVIVDLTDQRPYGDFRPARWAWLLDDVKPTTERCPWCMGTGKRRGSCTSCNDQRVVRVGPAPTVNYGRGYSEPCPDCCTPAGKAKSCPVCDGAGHCPPIPAKGKQRIWRWNPEGAHR